MLKSLVLLVLLSFAVHAQTTLRPWLGVAIESHKKGVFVKSAIDKTPAARSGIRAGDIITKIDDIKVSTTKDLIETILAKGVGSKVSVYLLRENKEIKKLLVLEARPDILKLAEKQLLNKKSPGFEGKNILIPSKKFTDGDLKGKVTVIEFWATWCPSCVASYPVLQEFQKRSKDIQVVTITNEEPKLVLKFLKKMGKTKKSKITYLSISDPEVYSRFLSSAIPTFFLVDSKGIIRKIAIGAGLNLEQLLIAAKKL